VITSSDHNQSAEQGNPALDVEGDSSLIAFPGRLGLRLTGAFECNAGIGRDKSSCPCPSLSAVLGAVIVIMPSSPA